MSREIPTLENENPFSEEYWDGHSFGDACVTNFTRTETRDQNVLDRLKEHRKREKAINEAIRKTEDAISAYYTTSRGGAIALARYGRREAFDPKTQRLGTIFRENTEMAWKEGNGNIRFDHAEFYGVVYETEARGERHTQAAYWIFGPAAISFFKYSDEPIEIGLVQHQVVPHAFPGYDLEDLVRVTSVEIMVPGTGETAKDPSPQPKGRPLRLAPVTSQG